LNELKVDVQFFWVARYNLLQFMWSDIVQLYGLNSDQTKIHEQEVYQVGRKKISAKTCI